MVGDKSLQRGGIAQLIFALALEGNDEVVVPFELVFLAIGILFGKQVDESEEVEGLFDVLAGDGADGVVEDAGMGIDAFFVAEEAAQLVAGLVVGGEGVVGAVGQIPDALGVDAVVEKAIVIVGVDGKVFDVGGGGVEDLMPVGPFAVEEVLEFFEFFDVLEVGGPLLGEVMDADHETLLAVGLMLPQGPEVEGVGNGRIDADGEVFHEHQVGVGEAVAELFGDVGAVPDVIVDSLDADAASFEARNGVVGRHFIDIDVGELVVVPREELVDGIGGLAEKRDLETGVDLEQFVDRPPHDGVDAIIGADDIMSDGNVHGKRSHYPAKGRLSVARPGNLP